MFECLRSLFTKMFGESKKKDKIRKPIKYKFKESNTDSIERFLTSDIPRTPFLICKTYSSQGDNKNDPNEKIGNDLEMSTILPKNLTSKGSPTKESRYGTIQPIKLEPWMMEADIVSIKDYESGSELNEEDTAINTIDRAYHGDADSIEVIDQIEKKPDDKEEEQFKIVTVAEVHTY